MSLARHFIIAATLCGAAPALAQDSTLADPATMTAAEKAALPQLRRVWDCMDRVRTENMHVFDVKEVEIYARAGRGELTPKELDRALFDARRTLRDPETTCAAETGIDIKALEKQWDRIRGRYDLRNVDF